MNYISRLFHIGSYRKKETLLIFVGDLGVQAFNENQHIWKSSTHFLAVNSDQEHLDENVLIPEKCKHYISIENYRGDRRTIEYAQKYLDDFRSKKK